MTGSPDHPVVVVGACGGSGTRVVAELLISSGFSLGYDLNDPRDNLLAVLLFNRRSVLIDTDDEFRTLVDIFYRRMEGETAFTPEEDLLLEALAEKERLQHDADFLSERLLRFRTPDVEDVRPKRWGWKMPPSHVMLHRLLKVDPSLRYVHVVRHGLDMAFSTNQNQLRKWAPVFLDRDVKISPRDALSYWCETQSRVRRIADLFPSSVLQVRFEDICQDPTGTGRRILAFVDHRAAGAILERFAEYVTTPATMGRHKSRDLSVFRPEDLAKVEAEGYQIGP
ncbi:hypothetical protein BSQ44_06265 [Aquibium oceanicum]|uniref:Sulfotransferase family protein n=2 Tax=Aquibium oceanicum TaxID=1670800 RepID=A0A1L3SNU5_9HYPH|nr:hypothetical protein BSQ44_06265 [Aquibium oceanicum]